MQTSAAEVTTSEELALLPDAIQPERDFSDPANFINRELSWLEFNRRVLEEAQDPTQPLIERVKFLTIFSNNLDEFFEIRVAGIKQQIQERDERRSAPTACRRRKRSTPFSDWCTSWSPLNTIFGTRN